jgi:signal peptidase I
MYPTLKPKDRIITARIYRFSHIRRGDILVFYSPELREMMIKRVIGLPNDLVEIKADGSVYINQTKADEPYVENQGSFSAEFQVPGKKYLFLGDNRAFSIDSRSWLEPFISERDIRGKAIFCIFPVHKIPK